MKELTIEQKAKRYDEAIKVAQRFYNNSVAITKKGLEDIFPELAESEDERIKKEIITYIKWCEDSGYCAKEEMIRWITFLEKQGELPTTIPKWKYKKDNAPLLRDSLILNKYGCVAKSPSGALVSDVWVVDYDELAKLPKEESEKQGEQKQELLTKEKALKNSPFVEQKPVWSEEDEKYWSIVIAEFSKCAGKSVSKDEWMRCNDWLNSLRDRVQPEPKPEWSEEDERNLNIVSSVINNPSVQGIYDYHKVNPTDVSNWLKERIRQHKQWKPSDEQLKALNTMNVTGCITEVGQGKSLVELYNDLKKLREK